jgi:hypothetical protein
VWIIKARGQVLYRERFIYSYHNRDQNLFAKHFTHVIAKCGLGFSRFKNCDRWYVRCFLF